MNHKSVERRYRLQRLAVRADVQRSPLGHIDGTKGLAPEIVMVHNRDVGCDETWGFVGKKQKAV